MPFVNRNGFVDEKTACIRRWGVFETGRVCDCRVTAFPPPFQYWFSWFGPETWHGAQFLRFHNDCSGNESEISCLQSPCKNTGYRWKDKASNHSQPSSVHKQTVSFRLSDRKNFTQRPQVSKVTVWCALRRLGVNGPHFLKCHWRNVNCYLWVLRFQFHTARI